VNFKLIGLTYLYIFMYIYIYMVQCSHVTTIQGVNTYVEKGEMKVVDSEDEGASKRSLGGASEDGGAGDVDDDDDENDSVVHADEQYQDGNGSVSGGYPDTP
jgi:hypothetical protein